MLKFLLRLCCYACLFTIAVACCAITLVLLNPQERMQWLINCTPRRLPAFARFDIENFLYFYGPPPLLIITIPLWWALAKRVDRMGTVKGRAN